VNAEGAEVDARQVVNRFERNTGNEGPSISLGGTTLNLGGGERTIGYRFTESILPVDAPVYVLGTVQESGEIGAPPVRRGGASLRRQPPLRRSARAEPRQDRYVARGRRDRRLGRGRRAARDRDHRPDGLRRAQRPKKRRRSADQYLGLVAPSAAGRDDGWPPDTSSEGSRRSRLRPCRRRCTW
jgi:hypothetical protein